MFKGMEIMGMEIMGMETMGMETMGMGMVEVQVPMLEVQCQVEIS
jgi:hypothetical protein